MVNSVVILCTFGNRRLSRVWYIQINNNDGDDDDDDDDDDNWVAKSWDR